jgi:Tol biopolymer transport system component
MSSLAWRLVAVLCLVAIALAGAEPVQAQGGGRWLAFRGKHYTGWLVHPDGSDLHRIPRPEDVATVTPWEWSPDGTKLALYGYLRGGAGSGGADYGIFICNADGSGLTDITEKAPGSQGNPHWAPDSTRLVFEGNRALFVSSADGSELRKLTPGGFPTWSPGGGRIAFLSATSDGRDDIFSIQPSGRGRTNLTRSPQWDEMPAWSPTGRWIAYVSHVRGTDQIFVMRPDGSDQHPITDIPNHALGGYSPTWSPDGRTIAFEVYRHKNWSIDSVRVSGRREMRLTHGPGDENRPVWSPRGRRIAFTASQTPASAGESGVVTDIYVMNADGSHVVRLTRDSGATQGSLTWQVVQQRNIHDVLRA